MFEIRTVLRRRRCRRSNASLKIAWHGAEALEQRCMFAVSAPWLTADVGSMTGRAAGSSDYDAGTGRYTVNGTGSDMWGSADEFHFLYQPLTGDAEIVVRLESYANTTNAGGARGGLMIRKDLTAGSPYAMAEYIFDSAGNDPYRLQYRNTTGGATAQAFDDNSYNAGTNPRYMKLQRVGNLLTAYGSADAQVWHALGGGRQLDLGTGPVMVGMVVSSRSDTVANTAVFSNVIVRAPQLEYTTSWLGNSFAGGEKHVPMNVDALYYESSRNRVYTNAEADEGEGEMTVFDATAGTISGYLPATHGSGREGGFAITANNNYVYAGMTQNYVAGQTGYPPSGTTWYAVRRYNAATLQPATWTAGSGYDKTMLVINTSTDVTGLAVNAAGELFVSDPSTNKIKVYNGTTMAFVREFAFARPRDIAVAPDGDLWIIQAGDGGSNNPTVVKLSITGVLRGVSIAGLVDPTALAVDSAGKVHVTDNGAAYRQVRTFTATGTTAGTLGVAGGIFAGTPGVVAPDKFNGLTGIGVDSSGARYVVSNGFRVGLEGSGVELRKFNAAGAQQWERFGLEFVDNADIDPANPNLVFTKQARYEMDYTKPAGQEWTYKGYTLDPFTYPNDPRARLQSTQAAGVVMRRLGVGGEKFMFMSHQHGSMLAVYRFTEGSEIAIPTAMFSRERINSTFPPNQPATGGWLWRDNNADGQFDAGEYTSFAADTSGYGFTVDDAGNVWRSSATGGVWKYAFTGVTGGVPGWAAQTNFVKPSVFTELTRASYDSATDVMILTGYTTARPRANSTSVEWGNLGTEIMRFDNWSTTANTNARTPVWRTGAALPYVGATGFDQAIWMRSIDVAGDYIFAITARTAQTYVLRKSDGAIVDVLSPGPEVAGRSGWIDQVNGINARQRADGEYLVFAEEVEDAKVLMYRWGQATPTGVTATPLSATSVRVDWAHAGANEQGFKIERSLNGSTGWTLAGTAAVNTTTFTDASLGAGTTYYYRVRAFRDATTPYFAAAESENSTTAVATTTSSGPLSRTGWTASAGRWSAGAVNAIDASTSTKWDNGQNQVVGEWWQVNMGSARTFSRVVLNQGYGAAMQFRVMVSNNATNWTEVGIGGGSDQTVDFTAVTAQYIRLEIVQPNLSAHWVLFDFNVYS